MATVVQHVDPGLDVSGLSGGELRVFPHRPVVDDGAPNSLQPFLQRTTTLSFAVAGSGMRGDHGPSSTFRSRLGADVYLGRWVALTAGIGVGYATANDGDAQYSALQLPVDAGIAGRFGDLRIDLGYGHTRVQFPSGRWTGDGWGTVALRARLVLKRRFDLSAFLQTAGTNVLGGGGFVGYPLRALGVSASLFGGGQGGLGKQAGGSLGLSYWPIRTIGASVDYGLTWGERPIFEGADLVTDPQISHSVTLALLLRPR
jgi:hypothetical protein